MCNFYQPSLTYLEQRYDFSDSNYQKKVASLALKESPFNFSHLCEAVEVLQLSKKLDMDALYDEYCVVLPHQQAIMQSGAPVVEKWATLLKHTHTKHDSISFFPLECTNHQCFSGEGLFTDDRMLDGHKEQMFGKPHQVRNPGEEQLHIQLQGLLHLCSEREGSPQCCTFQQEIQVQEET